MADQIKMYQGDTKTFTITITDESDSPVDCSTATAIKCTCYDQVGGDQQFQLTLAGGDISVGGAGDNVLTVTIGPTDTSAMTASQVGSTYYWDVEVTWSASSIQTFPRDSSGNPDLGELILYGELS